MSLTTVSCDVLTMQCNSSHPEVISPLHLELFGDGGRTKWFMELDVQLGSSPLAGIHDTVDATGQLSVVEDVDMERGDEASVSSSGIGSSIDSTSSQSSSFSSTDLTGASCGEDECDGLDQHQRQRQRYRHQIVCDSEVVDSLLKFRLGDEIVCISGMCVSYWTHDAVRAQIACLGLAPLPNNFKIIVRDSSNHYCVISARILQDGTLVSERESPTDHWDLIRKSLALITSEKDIQTEKVRLSPRGSDKYVAVVDNQVKLQPLTHDDSFVFNATLFRGYGVQCNNADYNGQLVCVLAFSSSDSDAVKFVCVRDDSSVALQECPDVSTLIDKQMLRSEDSRFFYQIPATDEGDFVVFESTELPNHYLAWNPNNQVCIKKVNKADRFKDRYLHFNHNVPA